MLSKKLGLWSDPTLTQDGHTPMLLIGNEATGQWTRTSALDNPKFTAQIIGEWMNSYKTATVGRSYAEAAPISKPAGTGEYQFRSLCSNCHTIGGGDKIGPDLAVALDTRERAWLIEYTVQPDIVRARNDATARMLAAKYPSVRMPNLYLTVAEVQSIFRFVETQKSRVASADAAPGPAAPRAAATTGSSPLVDAAVAIQVALAHDTMIGVAAQAATLRQAAAAFGEAGTAIETAATDLARQTTITDARRAFGTVSDALVASVRAGNVALGGGVRIAYCPMIRRSWLQKESPVANPYFGSRMLNCGELTN
jgi:mono/diheme cytochrome c family protein